MPRVESSLIGQAEQYAMNGVRQHVPTRARQVSPPHPSGEEHVAVAGRLLVLKLVRDTARRVPWRVKNPEAQAAHPNHLPILQIKIRPGAISTRKPEQGRATARL